MNAEHLFQCMSTKFHSKIKNQVLLQTTLTTRRIISLIEHYVSVILGIKGPIINDPIYDDIGFTSNSCADEATAIIGLSR